MQSVSGCNGLSAGCEEAVVWAAVIAPWISVGRRRVISVSPSRSSVQAARRAEAAIDKAGRLLVEQAPLAEVEQAVERARAATGGLLGWASAEALTQLIVEVLRCLRHGYTTSPELEQARRALVEALLYDGLLTNGATDEDHWRAQPTID